MKKNFLFFLLSAVVAITSCGQADEAVEIKSEINDDQGIMRSIKYYNNSGTLLFSKTMKCSIHRNHGEKSGIVDVTLMDTNLNRIVDIQGNGTLIMEELPEENVQK